MPKMMLRVWTEEKSVHVNLDNRAQGTLTWDKAQAIAQELKELSGLSIGMVFYKFELGGRPVYIDLEPNLALTLSKALHACSLLAEEQAKAEQIAFDSAILARAGAPFGLSNDPKIQDETKKEIAWNRTIRRSALPGIESAEMFGVPSLILGNPSRTKH